MTRELSAPPLTPIVWEAGLGRRVVLIEERLAIDARDKARAMLGGEPEYLTCTDVGEDFRTLFAWDWRVHPKRRANYLRSYYTRNPEDLADLQARFPRDARPAPR